MPLISVAITTYKRPEMLRRAVESVLMSAMAADMLILAAIVYDVRTRGRPHAVYVVGGAIVLAVQLLRGPLSTTQWWYALADSFARLAG